MTLRRVTCVLFALGLVACTRGREPRDDIAVLRATLEKTCGNEASHPSVISDRPARTSGIPRDWSRAKEYDRFLGNQPASSPIWPSAPICAKARIVPEREIEATFANDPRVPPGWEKFFETFQGARGYHAYSRPIYSSDGHHAVIFSDWRCEGLCGVGMVIELEWAGGRWRVLHVAGTWIS